MQSEEASLSFRRAFLKQNQSPLLVCSIPTVLVSLTCVFQSDTNYTINKQIIIKLRLSEIYYSRKIFMNLIFK